eukprot:6987225-Prymnesium_polylepis.1
MSSVRPAPTATRPLNSSRYGKAIRPIQGVVVCFERNRMPHEQVCGTQPALQARAATPRRRRQDWPSSSPAR